jgi:hypothetical protein
MTPQNSNGPQAVVLTKLAGLTRTLEGPRIELVPILAQILKVSGFRIRSAKNACKNILIGAGRGSSPLLDSFTAVQLARASLLQGGAGGNSMAPNKRPFPPSLSNIKSEYQRLCDDLGGPAEIGVRVDRRMLERCCQDYPLREVLPSLMLFQHDETKARRYWPWAAAAILGYKFEHNERKKYADEPSPKEIVGLLKQIGQSAHTLVAALCRLEDLSNRLDDPTARDRRDHIAQLNQIILRAATGRLLSDTNEDDDALLTRHFEKQGFLSLLSDVKVAAGEAQKQVDTVRLNRERVTQFRGFRILFLSAARFGKI